MKYAGSCVAIYPVHLTDDVLNVIRKLRALEYSDKQLTVMGEASLINDVSTLEEVVSSNHLKEVEIQKTFWNELSGLLEGKVSLKMPQSGSLKVVGGLSKLTVIENGSEVSQKDTTKLDRLFYLMGIPENSFKYYEAILETGLLILIALGSYQEIENAGNLIELSRSIDVSLHLDNESKNK